MRRCSIIRWLAWRALMIGALGSCATCFVAWGIALWDQRDKGTFLNADNPATWSYSRRQRASGPLSMVVSVLLSSNLTARQEYRKAGTKCVVLDPGMYDETRVWTFGWPSPCLSFTELPKVAAARPKVEPTLRIVGWTVDFGGAKRVLPFRVDREAMGWDIACWSGVFGVPLLLAPLGRRWMRRRAGRCVACGYDRSTIPRASPCPECGSMGVPAAGRAGPISPP